MYKIILLLVSLFMFSGCILSPKYNTSNKKVFDEEDIYIMYALRAEELQEYNASSSIYNTLYEKSNKKEYLYRSLQNDLLLGLNKKVVKKVDEIVDNVEDDYSLVRMKIIALIQLHEIEKAKLLAIKLVEQSKMVDDYILLSDIYVKQKKYDTAIKYLESAYAKDYNEKVLDKMAIVLYVNMQRKKDAIAQLETHTRVHGCSKLICSRLIGFYSNDNNIDGLLSACLRLYKIDTSQELAKQIIQIYAYKKEYIKLIGFLESSKVDNELLLQLYTNNRNYKKAAILADEIYSQTGDLSYLGQSAIFEYESAADKDSKLMRNRVIEKLEKVIENLENPLYLNYLGYILIDQKVDIKKGMEYVNRALLIEPTSIAYIDSLAWGYYKLGECKKANKIINTIVSADGPNDEEVLNHQKLISECVKLQEKKVTKKKKKSKKKKTKKSKKDKKKK